MNHKLAAFLFLACLIPASLPHDCAAAEPTKPLRAGIIGLDTSHVIEFTKAFNNPKVPAELAGVKIVAAYPGGSPDLPASWDRVKKYTEQVRGMGVEIVGSIDELLPRVDVVFLESVDGRPHLAQARPVIAAGKPLFIDKPMAASLADAMQIFRLAKEKNVPCFTASSLRFAPGIREARSGKTFGEVRGCTAWSPMTVEPHHPDLFWYGIHAVEALYGVMGPGCETVARVGPEEVIGTWKDGRKGIVRGSSFRGGYGALVDGSTRSGSAMGKFAGYGNLLVEIVKFFKTGKPPVSAEETLEVLAFMEASDESKRHNGEPVAIEDVMKRAQEQIAPAVPSGPGSKCHRWRSRRPFFPFSGQLSRRAG
jgi:hypothetical protein